MLIDILESSKAIGLCPMGIYKSGVQGGITYTSVISDESGNKGTNQHLPHCHMCKNIFLMMQRI